MIEQLIPELQSGHRALASELIPGDEVDLIYKALSAVYAAYLRVSSELVESSVDDPPMQASLDAAIRTELVALAKAQIVSPLSKLAWMGYVVISDSYALNPEPQYLLAWVVHRRLHLSDFYLSELRRLQENAETKRWQVTVVSPDGKSTVQVDRVFPMWGIEVRNGLDNYQKAKAWYRKQLMDRQIIVERN